MFLIFDTETTGLPKDYKAPLTDSDNWPRMIQLAWQCHSIDGKFLFAKNHVIKPDGFTIPEHVTEVHGISNEIANEKGIDLKEALLDFVEDVQKSTCIVGHNISFDISIVGAELIRCGMPEIMTSAPQLCTMKESTLYCAILRNGKPKRPTLTELHTKLFGVAFKEAHNAAADVEATTRCFLELIRVKALSATVLKITESDLQNFLELNTKPFELQGIEYESFKKTINLGAIKLEDILPLTNIDLEAGEKGSFIHTSVHSQYSILDGTITTSQLAELAKNDGMPAIALTDTNNMFGIKEFHVACTSAGIKPILGASLLDARRGYLVKEEKQDGTGYKITLLAKNSIGYHNLLHLTSIANTDGFYYVPRIDKELLEKYKDGLIVTSGGLDGEIAQHILNGNFDKAEETLLWYKNIFADDYYLEIMRHKGKSLQSQDVWEKQQVMNKVIMKLARDNDVKVIASNDVHFAEEEDGEAHDLLVCLRTSRDYNDNTREQYTKQEWFKTTAEMHELFKDVPGALLNTIEIANKVEEYTLDKNAIMPPFEIPESFDTIEHLKSENSEADLIEEFGEKAFKRLGGYDKVLSIKLESGYLRKLAFDGAKTRYPQPLSPEVTERLEFEINTIKTMGFPGYFLITQDFINAGKDMGVYVGPGRGSAAGSAVAYCIGITNIDPIKYDLLFERFLNPERVSMPDIDIDFDDDGRKLVLDFVINKYGQDKVAHICTFGTMAAKVAIKDVARVLGLPLDTANRMTKEFPENGKLKKSFQRVIKLEKDLGDMAKVVDHLHKAKLEAKKADKKKDELQCDVDLFFVKEIETARKANDQLALKTLEYSCTLEGSVRQTGVHACGMLICPDELAEHIPVMPTKGEELLSTQYDGHFVESIGLLKMDFLGLRTLSIIKDCIENIKLSKGQVIVLDDIPLDDKKTYQTFANGDTTAIFQFESLGMKKHLQSLKPNRFEDLVAMNALYRPGPMEYIPSFIRRKHGKEEVKYDHPMMAKYLETTFGIAVYQEQVMLLSRHLANFTKGMSDSLRKAMGKKKIKEMERLKAKFIEGCKDNPKFVEGAKESNMDIDSLIDKIWSDWEAFASYAFNKSHAVCYANLAYKTAYLKTHFPAEFMAANLSRNLSNITEVGKLMEECRQMKQRVFGPDVNLSYTKFTVDKNNDIRFGMAAIKNVGKGAVENIIAEREKNGEYKDIFDFIERVDTRSVNKKTLEALAESGALDSFKEVECRSQYFEKDEQTNETFIETLLRYSSKYKDSKYSSQNTLFDMGSYDTLIAKPSIPKKDEWSMLEKLNKEKELVGIYLSAHPLDQYKFEINNFCNANLSALKKLEENKDKELTVAGLIISTRQGVTKNGKPFGGFVLEDYMGQHEFMFFGYQFTNFQGFFQEGVPLYIKGKVTERKWGKKGTDEPLPLIFNVSNIDLLASIKEKMVKKITIKLDIEDLDNDVINKIKEIITNNEGSTELNFMITDRSKNLNLSMFSRDYKIDLNNDVLNFLNSYKILEYKIN